MTTPLGQNIRTRSIEVIPIAACPNNLHVPERLWTLSQFGASGPFRLCRQGATICAQFVQQ